MVGDRVFVLHLRQRIWRFTGAQVNDTSIIGQARNLCYLQGSSWNRRSGILRWHDLLFVVLVQAVSDVQRTCIVTFD